MQINTIVERINKYVSSLYYVITLAVFTYLCWLSKGNWSYLPATFFAIFSFLPLFGKNGKAYIPIFLFQIVIYNERISTGFIPGELLLTCISALLSIAIYLFINKSKLRLGENFIPFVILFSVFALSYIYNLAFKDGKNPDSFFYLFIALFILLVYILINSALNRGENLISFSKAAALLSLIISLETITVFIRDKQLDFASLSFSLGWSGNKTTAALLLTLSLPFLAMLINRKHYFYISVEIIVYLTTLLLSSNSSLIITIIMVIPIIFLSFRNYGKRYPYFILISVIVAIGAVVLLLTISDDIATNIANSIRSLNLLGSFPKGRLEGYKEAFNIIYTQPTLGESICSLYNESGLIRALPMNTILSTLVLGGVIGIVAYLFMQVAIFYHALKKKCKERSLYILFLVMVILLGVIDNSFYNIAALLFFVMANTCYQTSNRPHDAIIHQEYYDNYSNEQFEQYSQY